MVSELLWASEVIVMPLAQAQLAGEVIVVYVFPELLPTEKVDVAKLAYAVSLRHMHVKSSLGFVHW